MNSPNHRNGYINLSKQLAQTSTMGMLVAKLPLELWEIILDNLLTIEAPVIDPQPISRSAPCEHLHGTMPMAGNADNRGVAACLDSVYGPNRSFVSQKVHVNVLMTCKTLASLGAKVLYAKTVFLFTSRSTLNCFIDNFPAALEMVEKVTVIARIPPQDVPQGRALAGPSILQVRAELDGLQELKVYVTGWKGAWYPEKKMHAKSVLDQHMTDINALQEVLDGLQRLCGPFAGLRQKIELEAMHTKAAQLLMMQFASNDDLCDHCIWLQQWLKESGWKAKHAEMFGLVEFDDREYVRGCERILEIGGDNVEGPLHANPNFSR